MKNDSLNNPLTWLVGALLAAAIAVSCNLNGPDDMQVQLDQAANLAELQTATASRPELLQAIEEAQPGSPKEHAAAAAFCRHVKGPNAELIEVADGAGQVLAIRPAP